MKRVFLRLASRHCQRISVFLEISKVRQAALNAIPSALALTTITIRLTGFLNPSRKVFLVSEKNVSQQQHS